MILCIICEKNKGHRKCHGINDKQQYEAKKRCHMCFECQSKSNETSSSNDSPSLPPPIITSTMSNADDASNDTNIVSNTTLPQNDFNAVLQSMSIGKSNDLYKMVFDKDDITMLYIVNELIEHETECNVMYLQYKSYSDFEFEIDYEV